MTKEQQALRGWCVTLSTPTGHLFTTEVWIESHVGAAVTARSMALQAHPEVPDQWSLEAIKPITPSDAAIDARYQLTKREQFAAAALQGIMANPERWRDIQRRYDKGDLDYDGASIKNAEKAVSLADAMIKVLARNGSFTDSKKGASK